MSTEGEREPADCLFDDLHKMWVENCIRWQPPQNFLPKEDEDKIRRTRTRQSDSSGVEEKLKRKPRPTVNVRTGRDLELTCHCRSVALEEQGFIPYLDTERLITATYVKALTKDCYTAGWTKPTLEQILVADEYIWKEVGTETRGKARMPPGGGSYPVRAALDTIIYAIGRSRTDVGASVDRRGSWHQTGQVPTFKRRGRRTEEVQKRAPTCRQESEGLAA